MQLRVVGSPFRLPLCSIIAFAIGVVHMPLEAVDALYRRLSSEVFSGDVKKLMLSGTMHDTQRLEAVFRELAG